MSARSPSPFRQSDVTRALRGARAAGVDVGRVEIGPDGKIVVYTATAPAEPQTDLDKWMASHAGQS